jgi:ATP-dependent exoDNAse (exonuclease V) alpha subunit
MGSCNITFRDLDSNVKEIPVKDEGAAISMIRKIALFLQKKGKEFQVITPIHSGPLGTKRLNLILQRALNPDGGDPLRTGDRVIVTKNIYRWRVSCLKRANGYCGRKRR